MCSPFLASLALLQLVTGQSFAAVIRLKGQATTQSLSVFLKKALLDSRRSLLRRWEVLWWREVLSR
jgi:hypothetical protein